MDNWDPTARVAAPALFEAMASVAPRKIDEFNSQDPTNTARVYATARVVAPALFDAIACAAPLQIDELSPQALANTAWTYAAAGVAAPSMFGVIANRLPAQLDRLSLVERAQLHQVSLVLQLEALDSSLLPALLENNALLREAFAGSETAPSHSQSGVSGSAHSTRMGARS